MVNPKTPPDGACDTFTIASQEDGLRNTRSAQLSDCGNALRAERVFDPDDSLSNSALGNDHRAASLQLEIEQNVLS